MQQVNSKVLCDFLDKVCGKIKNKDIHKAVKKELECHILDTEEEYISCGFSEEEALEKAVNSMGDPVSLGKKLYNVHRHKVDWLIILSVTIIIIIGMLTIHSIYTVGLKNLEPDFIRNSIARCITYYLIGFAVFTAFYLLDYRKLQKHYKLFYICATIILLLSLLDGLVGGHVGQYIRISSIQGKPGIILFTTWIQTVYVCVFLYLLSFAGYLSEIDKNSVSQQTRYAISIIVAILLCFLHKSMISVLIIITASICMLSLIKVRKQILAIYISFMPIIVLLSKYVENSGEINSSIVQNPNNSFTYIIKELGVIIGVILLVSAFVIIMRLMRKALNANCTIGSLLTICVVIMFGIQLTWNIAMNLNILPKWDAPLPLIGYSGSNTIVQLAAIGLGLNTVKRRICIDTPKLKNGKC